MEIYELQDNYHNTKDESYLTELYIQLNKLLRYIVRAEDYHLPQHTMENLIQQVVVETVLKVKDGLHIHNFYTFMKRAIFFDMIQKKQQSKRLTHLFTDAPVHDHHDNLLIESLISTVDRYLKDEPFDVQERIINKLIASVGRQKDVTSLFYGLKKHEKQLLSFIFNQIEKELQE